MINDLDVADCNARPDWYLRQNTVGYVIINYHIEHVSHSI